MRQENAIQLSRHAGEKLQEQPCKRLGITLERINAVLREPQYIDNSDFPVLMAVGQLSKTLSLCVVYKFLEGNIRVITFFPARRGRYESKILPGR